MSSRSLRKKSSCSPQTCSFEISISKGLKVNQVLLMNTPDPNSSVGLLETGELGAYTYSSNPAF